MVDEYTRESLAIDVSGSIRSGRVIEVLSRLISERGEPAVLRSDNGPEFVSKAILRWAVVNRLETALIEPVKPWQNGTNESFNGKFRDECLALEWFRNRTEAKVVIETWRRHYNEVRPHSSLGQQTPAAFSKSCGNAAKPEAIFNDGVARRNPAGQMLSSSKYLHISYTGRANSGLGEHYEKQNLEDGFPFYAGRELRKSK